MAGDFREGDRPGLDLLSAFIVQIYIMQRGGRTTWRYTHTRAEFRYYLYDSAYQILDFRAAPTIVVVVVDNVFASLAIKSSSTLKVMFCKNALYVKSYYNRTMATNHTAKKNKIIHPRIIKTYILSPVYVYIYYSELFTLELM